MIRQLSLEKARNTVGWMTEGELSFLAESVECCKVIYEIGTYCGKSARAMADNSPDDCRIYCIDPWDYSILKEDKSFLIVDQSTFGQFQLSLYDHIKSGKVIPVTRKFEDFNPKEEADFIFIDGDHTYNSVIHDIEKSLGVLKVGGVIAGHDAHWPGVKMATDQILGETKKVDSIWWKRI